jgi:hypothetical protein
MSWMAKVAVQGFPSEDLAGAYKFLEVPESDRVRIKGTLTRLKAAVGLTATATA